MTFSPDRFRQIYRGILKPLTEEVIPLINNGTDFTQKPPLLAHVSRFREPELIAGSAIRLGDLRVLIYVEDQDHYDAIPKLTQKDRLMIRERGYSVINWDEHTRSIGADVMAIEVAVRG